MAYQVSQLHSYMDVIKSADFSSINAFFIGSSPGSHQGSALSHFGHMAARSVFRKHDVKVSWPLIIQCSSIGSLGQTPTTWCTSELKQSLGSAKVSFFHQCSKMQIIPIKKLDIKLVFSNFFGFSD